MTSFSTSEEPKAPTEQHEEEHDKNEHENTESQHSRAPPSPLKRTMWMIVIGLLLLLAYNSYSSWIRSRKPQIVHAQRYSKEYKFRPAASPIITEPLKDGRLRVRGAAPTTSADPKPAPTPKKTKKTRGKTRRAKKSKGKKSA
ncbi:hypothetical protein D9758_009612 [Tetrapyrgos nigripes]|uniref:Transmembrane protein n=1 Tax=Tetrapyrgos nigripes TaxID=182062 RepID=A0A8H5GCY0_9AGAR|nr:hypothetical protein D9758_009612 [Tetrapyrgos nigripes]